MRLATLSLCGAAVVVPLLHLPGLASPFLVPKTAALEVAAALALLGFALRRTRPGLTAGVGWAAAAVLATTVAAAVIAPHAPYALAALARWGALFALACAAASISDDRDARQLVLEAAAGGAALVSVIGLVQHLELWQLPIPVISAPGSTFGNRNLAAEAIAMALPLTFGAAAGAHRRGLRIALVAGLALELVYLAATRTRGAWIAGAAGLLVVVLLARTRWSRAAAGVAVAAALLAGIAAIVPGPVNPRDVGDDKRVASAIEVAEQSFDPRSVALRTRLGLWRRTVAMVGDHPVWGVGPGNWPVFFPRYAEPGAARDGVLSISLAPRQAHDDLLERTAETGVVGLAALAALGVTVVLAVRRRLRAAGAEERVHVAAAAGALAALAGAGLFGFPLEMPATLALGGLALGVATGEGAARPVRAWLPGVLAAAVLLLFAGLHAERLVRGSLLLGSAERAMRKDRGVDGATRALPALERAQAAVPGDAKVHLRTAEASLRLSRVPEALEAARRALAIEPWSPLAWATLASAQLASGDAPAARASSDQALALLHEHPFALLVAALAAEATGDRAAAATCRDRLQALANASDPATAAVARELLER